MDRPLKVQFNTHDEADIPIFEQGDNWEDNIVWDLTHSVPQANYQGQRVNFSQRVKKPTSVFVNPIVPMPYPAWIPELVSVFSKENNNSMVIPTRDYTKHGCSCPNCKNGIGECSDKCGECNAWDLGCEANCGIEGIQTDVVKWGKDTTKTITDTIIQPIESLKYLPLIAVGGIAAYLLTRKK